MKFNLFSKSFLGLLGLVIAAPLKAAEEGWMQSVDGMFGAINGYIATVIFFDVAFFTDAISLPFAVAWLVLGALVFTFRMGFINLRAFGHAIQVTRGRYDNPEDIGEVSHFQALTTALSATVGLGNIAGVAIAISIGGPGATFWMIVAGFLGMSSKFTECTLAQMYREVRPDGHIMGGAMEYLSRGLSKRNMAGFGQALAGLFCLMCIGGSLGGGNAFQVNQSLNAVSQSIPGIADVPWLYGIAMAALVGVVIIGGITRIAETAQRIVPAMCLLYISTALLIILMNIDQVPAAFGTIISGAFNAEAGLGGFIGVLVVGFQRAAFSNEAGIGSAAIAHSAARTSYPVREGVVALLEPFVDTIVVCTMTALVIIITGAYDNPEFEAVRAAKQGAALTSLAFGSVISWFPLVLAACVVLFAYSTMISWSYYGERCWTYLFGEGATLIYRVIFVVFVFLGAITSASHVLDFSDLMILSMAFPNILGLYLMSGEVRSALDDYMVKLKAGEFE